MSQIKTIKKYELTYPERKYWLDKQWVLANPEKVKGYHKKYYQVNRIKRLKASRQWRLKNAKRMKKWFKQRVLSGKKKEDTLKHSYRITLLQFEQMKNKQKNKCKICKQIFIRTPHVDHCHKTNKIRGLLCSSCNSGLGLFKDNSQILKQAIKYLIKPY